MNWYLDVLKKYAVFEGRARRKEYWMFVLFNVIIIIVLGVIDTVLGAAGILLVLYNLAIIIPHLAVSARRLHDTDRSGWWLLLALLPPIGTIVLIIFFVQDSTPGQNRFGANPKEGAA